MTPARSSLPVLIPRTVHRLWLGGPEPEWTRGFAATWERPGWQVLQWDEASVEAILRPLALDEVFERADKIAPRHVGQLKADILRLEILHRFGGVWADTDYECLRPIDELIEDAACFAAWEVQDVWVNNALMGAVAGHPFVEALLVNLPDNIKRNTGHTSRPNVLSGPRYVTRMFQSHRDEVKVLPEYLVYPYRFDQIRQHRPGDRWPDHVFAVHHWANKRREWRVAA